jgi:plastocyanin
MPRSTLSRSFGALLLFAIAGTARAETIHVKIDQIAYAAPQISAHVGDTVEWDNNDIVVHTATARNGAWDVTIAPNSKGSIVLKSAGTVQYYCRYHPNMIESIIVSE